MHGYKYPHTIFSFCSVYRLIPLFAEGDTKNIYEIRGSSWEILISNGQKMSLPNGEKLALKCCYQSPI